MELKPGQWRGIPYAVRLAEERGAKRIIVEPRIADAAVTGCVCPDVYAELPDGRLLFVEVEDSTGQKFQPGGPRAREAALRGKAEFVFVVGEGARNRCEKRLRELFGADVAIVYLRDLEARYGSLELRATSVGTLR
jgi:hypothetical protein